ncbi:MAG: hypothetical protein WKF96_04540 [Solirubrobacteraceae bacterium]
MSEQDDAEPIKRDPTDDLARDGSDDSEATTPINRSDSEPASTAEPGEAKRTPVAEEATIAELPAEDGKAAKARPKPDPVRCLVDLFTVKGANPTKLLRELEKGTSWKFDDADVEAALALLPERDPQLARTRQLLHDAVDTREGRFARAAGDFAIFAAVSAVDGLAHWSPDNGAEPTIALQELAERLGADLRHSKHQRRSHNVLMIALDLLSQRRGLAFEAAAPILREAIGRPPEYERTKSNPRRHRVASVTLPRNDIERVRDLLDLLQPWERELDDAQVAGRNASAEARNATQAAEEASQHARQLSTEVAELRTELQNARQEADAERDRVQDVRIHASVDVTELRARSLAFLNTRLRDLLATAKEASEVEPPRTGTAVRLLDQAIQELRKEVEWLRSSA